MVHGIMLGFDHRIVFEGTDLIQDSIDNLRVMQNNMKVTELIEKLRL